MILKRLLLCLVTAILLLAPNAVLAESAEQAYLKARDAYQVLQNSARKQMYRDQWERVFKQFEAVSARYPQAPRAADAEYMCGKTMAGLHAVSRIRADAERAVEIFQRMALAYPASNLADDALMLAGELLEERLADKSRAYQVYRQLVDSLPDGDMAPKARSRLTALAAYAPPPQKAPVRATTPAVSAQLQPGSGEGRLTALRHWSNPGYTRIVLDVSKEARFTSHYLAADAAAGTPPRLYIDIEKTGLDDNLQETTLVDDGLLRQIRTGRPQPDTVRVVLDLVSMGDYKVFPLSDPWRIVIDIAADKAPVLKSNQAEITALPGTAGDAIAKVLKDAPQAPPPHIAKPPAAAAGLRRIVVDAGHGGKDPGAVGANGLLEKDVTLKLAKELARELTRELGCEVILTRDRDVYLPLEERTAIANKVGADLFISLHANATKNRKAYGIETYYLNFSKNDQAAAVAARENGTSLKQVSDLELILFDLMANSKINESSRLAAVIQETLVRNMSKKYSDIKDLGVRQGPFYVLLGASMPSVLVETAFISHPREEKRLASGDFQKAAAQAIALAVKDYAVSNKLVAAR